MEILQLIEKEEKCGCLDSAAFGGFAAAVRKIAEDNENLQFVELADHYQLASQLQRPAILLQMRQLIQAGDWRERPNQIDNTNISTVVKHQSSLQKPLAALSGVGDKRAVLLRKLGLHNVEDLLFFFPRDYRNWQQMTSISQLSIGDLPTVIGGKVISVESTRIRNLHIIKAWIRDESGILPCIWYNQPFLENKLKRAKQAACYGKLNYKYGKSEFNVIDYRLDGEIEGEPLAPIYRSVEGLSAKMIRRMIVSAWERYGIQIEEVLPPVLIAKNGFLSRREAVYDMHFPSSWQQRDSARQRLAYEELLVLQAAIISSSANINRQGIAHSKEADILSKYQQTLPYQLTAAQLRVIGEIYCDMEAPQPMMRLVQGDVGCGKTAVAAAAIYKSFRSGYQSAFMAPTEILANQHYQLLGKQLAALGVKTRLLTGKTTAADKKQILEDLVAAKIDLLIGTHALIEDNVSFARLGLAITDEQHRFGVLQRERLHEGTAADILVMTATPIPRTLALTVYADLRLSVIDQLPAGRRPVETYAVSYQYEQRIHNFLAKEITQGHQAFVVCPLVEESEKLDLQSAVTYTDQLRQIMPSTNVGLLHGRMKSQEKAAIMNDFALGKINILVSTTVIEVGIDIPNATVMVIRDAERFGLAQLHQLRGRIGRGSEQSYCILIHNAQGGVAAERMRIISESNDGFAIAEADLLERGAGEFFGVRQHGLPELKVADLFLDKKLMIDAREAASSIVSGDIAMNDGLKLLIEEKLVALRRN